MGLESPEHLDQVNCYEKHGLFLNWATTTKEPYGKDICTPATIAWQKS
jgi:hypothetical protein